ncbi:uncharacterized protein LOC126835411 [Adelges cooleyi]|uniref:uncharacterized protein LOC126835411 n=1 Tax=Adelges cooleyi TaxID=133065 RepID=UPI0021804DE2|nr:uncharacterized protein LOC126835411 [Adelges cooleyi]
MYFKFSILLLTCLIFAESAPTDTGEDGVLETLYYVCKKAYDVPNERGLNEYEMTMYTGFDDVMELREIAKSIKIKNLDNISLKTFVLLSKEITRRLGLSILQPKNELNASSSNRPIFDDLVYLKLYCSAKRRFDAFDRGLTEYEMLSYVEIVNVSELREMANTLLIENLNDINWENFTLLMKEIYRRYNNSTIGAKRELEAGPSNRPPGEQPD